MIRFYAIHFNRVDFISLQQRTLKSFVVDKHELIIINNGRDDDRTSIFTVCKGLGLQCHSVESPRFDLAGESHIRAMDYCLANFIQKDDDISVILDHDMFAFAPVSIRQMLDGYAVAGLAQGKGSVKYLFPGLVALDVPNLPNFADFNLRGGKVDGIQCDVGAQSAVYLRDNPPARCRWLSTTGSMRMSQSGGE